MVIQRIVITQYRGDEDPFLVAWADVYLAGEAFPLRDIRIVREADGLQVRLPRKLSPAAFLQGHHIVESLLEAHRLADGEYPGFEKIEATFSGEQMTLAVP